MSQSPAKSLSGSLSGKIALITGGSRGIGAAIALKFADEGADVAFSYAASADKANALVKRLEAKGVRAAAFKADQADSAQVEGLINDVAAKFGRIDILVNNAGVFAAGKIDEPSNAAEIERLFAVNVGGVVAAVRAAIPHIENNGRIITIGSIVGDTSPFAGFADYSASKAAVAAYSRGWSRDLGAKGITVNTVQPGPIRTDMSPEDDSDFSKALRSATPLNRYGTVEEVAAAVAFLASPSASYITGTTLNVDGGNRA